MAKASMAFLKSFQKELSNMSGVGTSSLPPRYWYSTGNYVLNKIISGSFFKGVPQGRVTNLAGSSGAGKSFLAANLVRSAQQSGAYCLVIDSENALDDEFMGKIGVDVTDNYQYAEVTTIQQVIEVVSSFLKGYKKEYGEVEDAPQLFILIDSLDMLMTVTEEDNYGKGIQKGDQGQRNKQLKAMLRSFVQDIKKLNVAMVVTSQVYKNQDVTNGEGLWIVSDAVKYAASQIILLSKLKLKDESGKAGMFSGIRMKAEGYKTRFTKPFQNVTIEVPYETGMDPHSGLLDVAVELGALIKKGGWYNIAGSTDNLRESTVLDLHVDGLLLSCEAKTNYFLQAKIDGDVEFEDEDTETTAELVKRRRLAATKDNEDEEEIEFIVE